MSFSVAIVGLPNVGKSTLFKALTKKSVEIAEYPFTTIHPNKGIIEVPDERLKKIAQIVKPEKITPTTIEFVDVAGLVKGAHKGEGLGNQFLAEIRNCDAILMVLRGFENEKVENVLGEIDPQKEIDILKTELLMKDLETLEKILPKIESDIKKDKKFLKKFEFFKKIKNLVSQGKLISEIDLTDEEKKEIQEYQFLTKKPIIPLINVNNKKQFFDLPFDCLAINFKDEEDLSELSETEIQELKLSSQLDKLIIKCYNILDLITFFTIAGGKEIRAWTLKKGKKAIEAAGVVHSDFQEKFIRAEVISWKILVENNGWLKTKEKGLVKIVGKDYQVQDGDVIEFKI